ncbi:hypothetical protein MANES_03G154300v8 [Manihot esculenta]|uniref:S-protein homolog n=1 Tax=Manihot esculenta TaxID=3983 RepID=A0A2C9W9A3_MANES|nr:hypothetical protein MANES_03G154300v8 [Manihot esculenta]
MWKQIILLILVISSAHGREKKLVEIINDLGPNIELKYHCKSKNDDLGQRVLPYNGSWYFTFRPNLLGNTLFYCQFSWGQISHWFNIYEDSRDRMRCHDCLWYIRGNGPCTLNVCSQKFDLCFQWNS